MNYKLEGVGHNLT